MPVIKCYNQQSLITTCPSLDEEDGLCPEPFLQIEESLKLEFTNESLMFEVLQNKISQMSEKFISNIVLNQSHSFCKDKTFLVNLITCAIGKAF